MPSSREVLLIGSNERAALDLAHLLGRAGHRVATLRLREAPLVADSSRYVSESIFAGLLETGVSAWRQRVGELLRQRAFSDVIPVDELAHELVCGVEGMVPDGVRLHGPGAGAQRSATDRLGILEALNRRAARSAPSAGVRTPSTVHVPKGGPVPPVEFPCVVRAVREVVVADDEPAVYSTKRVRDARQLDAKLRDDLPRTDVLLHAPVGGEQVDLCVCANDGVLLAASAARRTGSALVSEAPGAEMLEVARAILAQVRWTGLLRLQFIRQAGVLTFWDVRPGAGGLLAASWGAGVDFARILLEAKNEEALNRRAAQSEPLLSQGGSRARSVEQLRDPAAAIAQATSAARRFMQKVSMRVRPMILRLPSPPISKRGLRESDSVLFVCKGNINRSVVAEYCLRARGFTQVASAGLLGMTGRRPSEAAEKYIGQTLGMPTSPIRSQSVYRALRGGREFSVIVCFERRHIVELTQRHPQLRDRLVLLSEFGRESGRAAEIADPHGRADREYEMCFERISELLQQAVSDGTPAANSHELPRAS
jgi:protein-tyrosine-phosphatase